MGFFLSYEEKKAALRAAEASNGPAVSLQPRVHSGQLKHPLFIPIFSLSPASSPHFAAAPFGVQGILGWASPSLRLLADGAFCRGGWRGSWVSF